MICNMLVEKYQTKGDNCFSRLIRSKGPKRLEFLTIFQSITEFKKVTVISIQRKRWVLGTKTARRT